MCLSKKSNLRLGKNSLILLSQIIYKVDFPFYFMQLQDAIKKRQSIRKYLSKKPDWRKILRAIDMARFAPSAGGMFFMKFILVSDSRKVAEISEATAQSFVGNAHYIVVAVSDDSKLARSYGERGKRFSSQQAGAAIENFLLALVEEGLVTTWVGYFDEDRVRRVLGIPDGLVVEAIFPIGLETKIRTKYKAKMPLENIIYFDKWGNKKMEPQTRVSVESI